MCVCGPIVGTPSSTKKIRLLSWIRNFCIIPISTYESQRWSFQVSKLKLRCKSY